MTLLPTSTPTCKEEGDINGNITSQTNVARNTAQNTSYSETFQYDAFNQVSNFADLADGQSQSWSGDPLGDNTSITRRTAPPKPAYTTIKTS